MYEKKRNFLLFLENKNQRFRWDGRDEEEEGKEEGKEERGI